MSVVLDCMTHHPRSSLVASLGTFMFLVENYLNLFPCRGLLKRFIYNLLCGIVLDIDIFDRYPVVDE